MHTGLREYYMLDSVTWYRSDLKSNVDLRKRIQTEARR